jgi:hypothetical protein
MKYEDEREERINKLIKKICSGFASFVCDNEESFRACYNDFVKSCKEEGDSENIAPFEAFCLILTSQSLQKLVSAIAEEEIKKEKALLLSDELASDDDEHEHYIFDATGGFKS